MRGRSGCGVRDGRAGAAARELRPRPRTAPPLGTCAIAPRPHAPPAVSERTCSLGADLGWPSPRPPRRSRAAPPLPDLAVTHCRLRRGSDTARAACGVGASARSRSGRAVSERVRGAGAPRAPQPCSLGPRTSDLGARSSHRERGRGRGRARALRRRSQTSPSLSATRAGAPRPHAPNAVPERAGSAGAYARSRSAARVRRACGAARGTSRRCRGGEATAARGRIRPRERAGRAA